TKDDLDKRQPREQVDQRWAFADTAPGKVPPGWNFASGQIRIQDRQGRRAIELVGVQGTAATLPPVVLNDPFFLEAEVGVPQKNAGDPASASDLVPLDRFAVPPGAGPRGEPLVEVLLAQGPGAGDRTLEVRFVLVWGRRIAASTRPAAVHVS